MTVLFYHISSAQDTDPFSYNANIRPSAQAYEMTKYGNPVNEWSERNITYDFGDRFYDPLTDKYTSLTQYNYCGGDPVNYIDFHGDTLMVVDQYEINAINNGLLNEHRGLLRFNNGILDPTSIPNSDDFFINS